MQIQHPDKRVRRTKQNLYNALLQLMHQKTFEKITVTEIVGTADYNRGTFYVYYDKKEDMLEEMITNIFDEMTVAYRQPYAGLQEIDLDTLPAESIALFDHFLANREFYQLLLRSEMSGSFQAKLTTKLESLFREDFDISYAENDPQVDAALFTTYRTYGIIGMILSWLHHGCTQTPAYMSSQLLHVMRFHAPKIRVRKRKGNCVL